MKEQQYVIAKIKKDDKPFLARIHSIKKDGSVSAILEKDVHIKQSLVTLDKKQIKVNLGLNPLPGRAYGLDLDNLFKKTIEHDFWGNIHFFITPEKETMKLLKKSLDSSAVIVKKMGLEGYTKFFETEIRAKKGKWAGMYLHSKDQDKLNRVWYAPEFAQDVKGMEYVILHEFAHVVRYNGINTNKMRNRWQRLYQKTIEPVQIEQPTLQALLKDIEEYDEIENSFRTVFKQLTDDIGPRANKAILQWFKQTHKIGSTELEVMWRASKTKDLIKFWPDHTVDTHDLKPAVSDYATKSCEELFAESFSFHCQKKKLPSAVEELLELSISFAKANLEK